VYLDPPVALALSEQVAEQAAAQIAENVKVISQSMAAHR
jgi:hypothetical protein